MTNNSNEFDVIIIGGGIIGNTLALALGQQSLRIALIDSQELTTIWSPESFDLRVSAITKASQHIFESLGIWPTIIAKRATPFQDMRVWDATGTGQIHFDCTDIGATSLGHIVENNIITSSLVEQLNTLNNVSIFSPVQCRQLAILPSSVQLSLSNQLTLNAELVVGADGFSSWVRQQVDIPCHHWSYKQTGIVATVKTEHPHQHTAWQRFLPSGPIALLPLADQHCSIVWSHQTNAAKQLLAMDAAPFNESLQRAIGDSPLGDVTAGSPRAGFPLRLQHSKQYTQPRVVLVGDAAHTIHPLAGQGANLGLMDVACLTEVLVQATRKHTDLGQHLLLRRYERWRKAHNVLTMSAMDGLKRLFGNETKPVIFARNIGLNFTHFATPIKHYLTHYATGMHHNLPPLAKGRGI